MASVKTNVLGNLKGKIGNIAARTVRGKTIFAARPSSYKLSQTIQSIQLRSKFKTTVDFTTAVLSIPDLFSIWEKVKLPGKLLRGTVFQRNYPFCAYDKPTVSNVLTPGGFTLAVQNVEINGANLEIELNALNSLVQLSPEEVNLTFSCLVVYHNPINEAELPYRVFNLTKDEAAFNFAAPYSGSINVDPVQQNTGALYQEKIIFLSVSTKTAVGEIIQYSSTYSNES